MKKMTSAMFIGIALFLMVTWLMGCTGDGIYDHKPEPTYSPSGTITPTAAPTGIPVLNLKVGKELKEFANGRVNTFDIKLWGNGINIPYTNEVIVDNNAYYWGENLIWSEAKSLPTGAIINQLYNRTKSNEKNDMVTGLQKPSGIELARQTTDMNDNNNNVDYLYFSSDGNPSGGSVKRATYKNNKVVSTVDMVTGLQGDIAYMTLERENGGFLFFTTNAGGVNSTVQVVQAGLEDSKYPTPAISFATNMNQAHDILVFRHSIPNGAVEADGSPITSPADANTFVFVTEQAPVPDGQVTMFNVTKYMNGQSPNTITKTVLANNQQRPSKITFIPDFEEYTLADGSTVYGHSRNPGGYLLWTNFDPVSGRLMGARLGLNNGKTELEIKGSIQIVVDSLKAPYDVISPEDFRYVFLNLGDNTPKVAGGSKYEVWSWYNSRKMDDFKKVYVSSNLSEVNNGNWYEINLGKYTGTAFTPESEYVVSYLSKTALYPFNGVVQVYLYYDSVLKVWEFLKIDLFFTSYNYLNEGNDPSNIYIQENTYQTF